MFYDRFVLISPEFSPAVIKFDGDQFAKAEQEFKDHTEFSRQPVKLLDQATGMVLRIGNNRTRRKAA